MDTLKNDYWKVELRDYAASNLRDYNIKDENNLDELTKWSLIRLGYDPSNINIDEAKDIISNYVLFESVKSYSEIPTYYDMIYESSSKLFESEQIQGLTPDEINEAEKFHNLILEKLKNKESIDEGILSGLAIGVASALIGPSIMKAVCKALGVEENGVLGKLLTSKLVAGSIGYTLGK